MLNCKKGPALLPFRLAQRRRNHLTSSMTLSEPEPRNWLQDLLGIYATIIHINYDMYVSCINISYCCVCMCISYTYIYISILYTYTYVYIYIYTHIFIYIYKSYTPISHSTFIYIYIHTHIHNYIPMCVTYFMYILYVRWIQQTVATMHDATTLATTDAQILWALACRICRDCAQSFLGLTNGD